MKYTDLNKYKKDGKIKLDVSCGPNKKNGCLGVDILLGNEVDLVINLDTECLPKSFWSHYVFKQEYLDYYLKSKLILILKKVIIVSIFFLDPLFNFFANNFLSIYKRLVSLLIKIWKIEFI